MNAFNHLVCFLFITTAPALLAEIRPWKNVEGTHSVQGEFIKSDAANVVIRKSDGKEITIPLNQLHEDEIRWLKSNESAATSPKDSSAFFDNLTFRDNRESVLSKLKKSKLVEMTTDETFIGRSGLNGVFRIQKKIGKLDAFLYFDWTEAGRLKELTLQTETVSAADYQSFVEPSWNELIELLNTLYGKPLQKSPLPSAKYLTDGIFLPTHLWKLEAGGSVLLGIGQDGTKYQLVVRFTEKKVELKELP